MHARLSPAYDGRSHKEPSREAAKDYSPRRKPWGAKTGNEQAPKGAKEKTPGHVWKAARRQSETNQHARQTKLSVIPTEASERERSGGILCQQAAIKLDSSTYIKHLMDPAPH